MDTTKVKVGEREVAVYALDFTASEELVLAYGDAEKRGGITLLRVYAAAIGLCTRFGRESKADYAASKYDILAYGGKVYAHLRQVAKLTPTQITEAGLLLMDRCGSSLFPREEEVQEALGKSKESGES